MNQNPLPIKTLHDLGVLLVVMFETAWAGTKHALRHIRPFVEPPADLEVHSTNGGLYSGALVIDDNSILAGVVVRTGQEPTSPSPMRPTTSEDEEPLITPPAEPRRGAFLRSWADDPRDDEEEEDAWWPRRQR